MNLFVLVAKECCRASPIFIDHLNILRFELLCDFVPQSWGFELLIAGNLWFSYLVLSQINSRL